MDPSPRLRELALERLRLVDELEATRLALADEIRRELSRGVRQTEIVKFTGYTREQVRRIDLPGQATPRRRPEQPEQATGPGPDHASAHADR